MATVTVLTSDGVAEVEGDAADGSVLVEPARLAAAIGWILKPEGLCRGDVCVPVRDDASVGHGDRVDLVAVAGLLGSTCLLDDATATVAVSVAADRRRGALVGRTAPDFTLPDLEGSLHSLGELQDRKRLLVVFASW